MHALSNAAMTSRRWHFSLRGLMIGIFGIAAGLTEVRHDIASWTDGLFVALATWGAVAIGEQACDLWRHFRRNRSLSTAQRGGVRWAMLWRLTAIALLAVGFALRRLQTAGIIALVDQSDGFQATGKSLRAALFDLLLLLMAARPAMLPASTKAPRKWFKLASLAAASLLALLIWWEKFSIMYLVHVAIEGIESTAPVRFLTSRTGVSFAARYPPFIWGSLAGTVACTLAILPASKLPALSRRRFALAVAMLCLSLLAGYASDVWLATSGFRRASPYMHGALMPHSAHVWIAATLVVAVLTGTSACRWSAVAWEDSRPTNDDWRQGRRYLHEGFFWTVMLAVAAGSRIVHLLMASYQWSFGGPWYHAAYYMLMWPDGLLAISLSLVACYRIVGHFRRETTLPRGIAALDPARFAIVWCALLVAAPAAIVALAAFSFALWLTPWYNLPLPSKW
ncbi:MAG TPA: hypothetical protein VFI31_04745 [Pirellulales bacterium]|nr:hypothetical protein [Pirellulales bacterium]